jgi:hypothetical protein
VPPSTSTRGEVVPAELSSQLKKSGQVKFDSTGHGVLQFYPDHANQRWEVESVVVSTNQAATATTVPVVNLALNTVSAGTASPGNSQGSTWNGNQETFTGMIRVGECDFLSVLFSPPAGASGTPLSGVTGYAVLSGTKYTRRG